MPFITQGKTNWKFLLIVVVLAIIVGGRTLWLIKQQIPRFAPQFVQLPEIKMPENTRGIKESDCDYMGSQYYKDICYLDVASSTQDLSICEKIQNHLYKRQCYTEFAQAKQDLLICDKIQDDDKYFCYRYVAKAKEDLSICDQIPLQGTKDACYLDIAKIKQDPSICEQIQVQGTKDYCYLHVAIAKQDSSLCSAIESQNIYTKDDCYLRIFFRKKDLAICNLVQDQAKQINCYADFANTIQDPSICDLIKDQNIKNNCICGAEPEIKNIETSCSFTQLSGNEIANWKSYKNEDDGYEIKCPTSSGSTSSEYGELYNFNGPHDEDTGNPYCPGIDIYVSGEEKDINQCLKLEDPFGFDFSKPLCQENDEDCYRFAIINGVRFLCSFYADFAMQGAGMSGITCNTIHNNKCYSVASHIRFTDFSFLLGAYPEEEIKQEDIQNQIDWLKSQNKNLKNIISTFKFIE